MGILDIFSRRGKAPPDVYQYATLPEALRVQIVHILQEVAGPHLMNGNGWPHLARVIAKEHGFLELPNLRRGVYGEQHPYEACINYLLQSDTEMALDVIELCFRAMEGTAQHLNSPTPDDVGLAIDELNERLRQHGCGYQYESGKLVRVDSQYLHKEAVVPALTLLATKGFEGPAQEFMSAHEHFRSQRNEEAVTDACKAFESTMKAVCHARGWRVDPKATANPLIQTMIEKGVVPPFSQEQLQNVAKCLLGVATLRNKNAGHGAGHVPRSVPSYYAAYALHLAASNIVFIVESHLATK